VITDSATNEKMLCPGPAFLPLAAVVDYELTLSMPPRLTADTGIDALTHAVEAYVSKRANPFSDGLALAAIQAIGRHLRRAYHDGGDVVAREAMTLAATQAGIAFSNSSVALVHGMSRPIGAHFHVAHGLSNAMLFPAVTAFSLRGAPSRYADCARALGAATQADSDAAAADKLVVALRALCQELAVPTPHTHGIQKDAWFGLTSVMAEQALASGSPANNPVVPTAEEIRNLYAQIYA
jgi:alcohol dehydrogenase